MDSWFYLRFSSTTGEMAWREVGSLQMWQQCCGGKGEIMCGEFFDCHLLCCFIWKLVEETVSYEVNFKIPVRFYSQWRPLGMRKKVKRWFFFLRLFVIPLTDCTVSCLQKVIVAIGDFYWSGMGSTTNVDCGRIGGRILGLSVADGCRLCLHHIKNEWPGGDNCTKQTHTQSEQYNDSLGTKIVVVWLFGYICDVLPPLGKDSPNGFEISWWKQVYNMIFPK